MAALTIDRADVQKFVPGASDDVVDEILAGTMARARRIAPCLAAEDLSDDIKAEARDILLNILVRAVETGTGEVTTLIAGPMQQTVDTTKRRAQRFRPDEIRELQALCGIQKGGAYTITLGYDANDAYAEEWTPDAT